MQLNKILLVDDDAFVAKIYSRRLGLEGFHVEVAVDGEHALQLVKSFKPDGMILDLMLPKLNGVEVLKQLRADEESRALPVLVLTNSYLGSAVAEAQKAGATKCISKTDSSPKLVADLLREMFSARSVAEPRRPAPATGPAPGSARGPALTLEDDRQFRVQQAEAFALNSPRMLIGLKELLQQMMRKPSEEEKVRILGEMSRKVHALTGSATIAELRMVARLASAFEALIGELHEKPASVTPSIIRTMAQTMDFLDKLVQDVHPGESEGEFSPLALVVDDEPLSRRAVVRALAKGQLAPVNVDNSATALLLLRDNAFELVTLDIDMPGMSGLELCKQMRTMENQKQTPVIFVTGQGDFQTWTQSALSGGNDFIAKPFLFMELTLKALIHVVRRRLAKTQALKPSV